MADWGRVNGVVLLVIGLHLFIYSAAVGCAMLLPQTGPWLGWIALGIIPWLSWSVPGVAHLGTLTAGVAASLAFLLVAVVADPGSVPEDYQVDAEQQQAQVVEVKKKSGGARVCQKCGRGKPPRAHHCRICRRCIRRMDHHCPWLNNCVGHGNYRAFLAFLVYATAATCHALGLLSAHAVYALHAATSNQALRTGPQAKAVGLAPNATGGAPASYSLSWAAFQICATATALPLAVALCGLTIWNGWLLSRNLTTIEYHEGITAQIRATRAGAAAGRHPYDLGPLSNFASVCGGPEDCGWCLPSNPAAEGPGTAFPTVWDEDMPSGGPAAAHRL